LWCRAESFHASRLLAMAFSLVSISIARSRTRVYQTGPSLDQRF
jgi:hypothetical protein